MTKRGWSAGKWLKQILFCAFLAPLGFSTAQIASAEPWLDTRDSGLRLDIERLSSAGIIKVPINTRPLMWSGILNDLEAADRKALPEHLSNSFSRVINAGRKAARINNPQQSVKLSAANQSQVIRHFGDSAREEGELSLRHSTITKHFAYNLEVTRTANPWDGEKAITITAILAW